MSKGYWTHNFDTQLWRSVCILSLSSLPSCPSACFKCKPELPSFILFFSPFSSPNVNRSLLQQLRRLKLWHWELHLPIYKKLSYMSEFTSLTCNKKKFFVPLLQYQGQHWVFHSINPFASLNEHWKLLHPTVWWWLIVQGLLFSLNEAQPGNITKHHLH